MNIYDSDFLVSNKETEALKEVLDSIDELKKYMYIFANFPNEINELTQYQIYMVYKFLLVVSKKKLYLNFRVLENLKNKENIDPLLYKIFTYWVNSINVTNIMIGLKSCGLYFNRTF